jgi:hypothetical protein
MSRNFRQAKVDSAHISSISQLRNDRISQISPKSRNKRCFSGALDGWARNRRRSFFHMGLGDA